MNQIIQAVLGAFSNQSIEIKTARKLADLKKLDPVHLWAEKEDILIKTEYEKIPLRLYFPSKEEKSQKDSITSVIFFIHGGGWSTESVQTYDRICSMLSKAVGKIVVSVEYRLAPEHPFPAGLEDCYLAARALYHGKIFPKIDPRQISVMGDSSGGNLAAALCLLARDRGEFHVHKQILIYPAVNNCYTLDSVYDSIRENGEGYLLTRGKMHDYLQLYIGKPEDLQNSYVAPVLAENLKNMPETLLLSAEFDPLRDEGEDYAKKLKEAGNMVLSYRMKGAFHGYFALGSSRLHVEESFAYIDHFLREG